MADPLQFAQQLAHQTSAATNQYRAQGADIGGPIAQGLQTGIGIGMNFEEFELKQAMAEAQVQENQIRMQNLAQETILRQGIAQTRMMESQEKMMAMDLEARDKAEGRSNQRERLKLEAQQEAPLPLANGKWRVVTPGAGGQMSSMDVDADHPAMMPWKSQWQGRGGGSGSIDPDKILSMADDLDARADKIDTLGTAKKLTEEQVQEMASLRAKAARVRDAALSKAGLGEPAKKQAETGGLLSPSTMVMNAARMASAKVAFDKIPGLGASDAQDLSKRAYGVGKGLKLMGQGWMTGADGQPREASDDEMAQSIIKSLLDPKYPVAQRELLIDLIRSYGQ